VMAKCLVEQLIIKSRTSSILEYGALLTSDVRRARRALVHLAVKLPKACRQTDLARNTSATPARIPE